ncbi:MAG: hypothetical protein OD811_05285, partial [Alphaproteobacteria bacterium]
MAESEDISVPALGESVAEGTLGAWLVAAGDGVVADQPLVEIETDKAAVEIYAPFDGVVVEILVEGGADVAPGTVIARLARGVAGGVAGGKQLKVEGAKEAKSLPPAPPVPPAPVAPVAAPTPTPTPTPVPAPAPTVAPVIPAPVPVATGGDLEPSRVGRSGAQGGISTRDLQQFLHSQAVATQAVATQDA